jgi:hypothetical protein
MTAMNTAIKKGTRMELAAFIPATTMIKPARVNTGGTLNLLFTFLSIGFRSSNFDEIVKSLKRPLFVIPVETGIQSFQLVCRFWIPACAGMTSFYETISFHILNSAHWWR